MTEKLDNGDTNARKGYIRSIGDAIEVDDKAIRIIGNKDVLRAVYRRQTEHERKCSWFCTQMARQHLAAAYRAKIRGLLRDLQGSPIPPRSHS